MLLCPQDALKAEHGRDFMGARIVVEWARGPKDPAAPPGPRVSAPPPSPVLAPSGTSVVCYALSFLQEYRGRERYRDDDDRRGKPSPLSLLCACRDVSPTPR